MQPPRLARQTLPPTRRRTKSPLFIRAVPPRQPPRRRIKKPRQHQVPAGCEKPWGQTYLVRLSVLRAMTSPTDWITWTRMTHSTTETIMTSTL